MVVTSLVQMLIPAKTIRPFPLFESMVMLLLDEWQDAMGQMQVSAHRTAELNWTVKKTKNKPKTAINFSVFPVRP